MLLSAKRRQVASDDQRDMDLDAQQMNRHKLGQRKTSAMHQTQHRARSKQQFSSILLFAIVIVLVNLCSFWHDFEQTNEVSNDLSPSTTISINRDKQLEFFGGIKYLGRLEQCLHFIKLMFSNPMRMSRRTLRYTQAEAKVLGKMAKVWYIKKKIKKLGKKLKKHTIAVPVFTAIPIYEHSYYPQPHVTHMTHGSMHHHAAAASSYAPAVAQLTPVATSPATTSVGQQQIATSASNNNQVVTYRMAPSNGHHNSMYHHPQSHHQNHHSAAHQIINAYAPSPPLYVDEAGGLYGHYGNAYGRYDGGYQYW